VKKRKDMENHCSRSLFRRFLGDRDATATAEFALVFPLMFTLLMGVDELGTGIMINQKCIAATQMVADLVARNVTVDGAQLDDYIRAGQLALNPYDTTPLGFDITSVSYNSDDEPVEDWHYTVNMTHTDHGLNRTAGLGVEGDGALVVAVAYNYRPPLSSTIVSQIDMEEFAFSRGRRVANIACPSCPAP
jgi:Flp pilus assembly protein TadG